MATPTFISITDLCEGYKIEREYVLSLKEFGLINLMEQSQEPQLDSNELRKLEKILNFHQELNINFEGIEVILQLLEKVERLNSDVNILRRKLCLFEDSDIVE
ncbi:MerR HTH family regulatory protein [Flavobacteriaceae bacterium MAR_2010_188]|nr:MerR HTH family regulatory protein [Flavobacteriaceae bacterium MAR_2010_188]